MSDFQDHPPGRRRGQALFALGFLIVALILLDVLGRETTWKPGKGLFAQARFWPAVGVAMMVGATALHYRRLPRCRLIGADWAEAKVWAQALEYALWFLAYVWLVPLVGYLPVTVAFAVALTWRLGYRSRAMLAIAAGFAVAVVVIFKAFLQVKIPGAALYEHLPDGARSLAILYF